MVNINQLLPTDYFQAIMAGSSPSALNPFVTVSALGGVSWKLDGNTNGAEKYIGTNDNFALPFRTNNIEVARFTTDGSGLTRLYINQTTNLHGSNSGIQYATTFANRAQLRVNAYGNHTGVAGITGFKSRGATVGATQSVLAGDTIFRITAIGISGDNASLNLAALVDLKVSPGGVFPAYVATDFTIDLMNLAGVRTQKFIVTSEGLVGLGTALIPTNTLHIGGTFRYVDGNQAAGKVLTSDINGVASWQVAGGGGGGTLAATLLLGNTSGASDISMDLGQVIKASTGGGQLDLAWFATPDYVGLTNDAGVGLSGIVELFTDYAGLSHAGSEVGVNQYMMGTEYLYDTTGLVPQNVANLWSTSSAIGVPLPQAIINIGVSKNYSATYVAYQDISIQDNSTFAAGIGSGAVRNAIFIGTENVRLGIGVENSVVIGGILGNALLAASNTVYVGNNLSVINTLGTASMSFAAATTTMNIGSTLPGTNGTLNMTAAGVGGTPRINMTGGTGGTAGINVQSGGAGSATGYFGTYSTIPGSPYRNVAFGLLCAATAFNPRMFLWQQNTTREIVLLTNASDDSTTVNVGVRVAQDTVVIQRIYNLGAPPVLTAKLNVGGSTLALSALNIQTSVLIPTAPGAGDMWYDGTDMYLDNGALTATTRQKVARVLTATAILNFGATPANSSSELTITVTGAANQDVVALGVDNGAILPNSCYTAWVSAANTVTVRFNNYSTAGAQDPANGQRFKVTVFKNV